MLLERGCSVSAKGAHGYSALHQVAYTRWASLCEFILRNGGNLDSLSKNGSTPLLIASREGHIDVVEMMLRFGADPNDGGDKGLTPLLLAAAEGRCDIVELLLSYKADANLSLYEGRTPLHEAVESGQTEVCRILVSKGNSRIDAEDSDGMTPVLLASHLSRPDLVEILENTKCHEPTLYREPDKRLLDNNNGLKRLPPESAHSN
jgi:ankyrin repeat protein